MNVREKKNVFFSFSPTLIQKHKIVCTILCYVAVVLCCFQNLFSCELRYQFHKLCTSIYLLPSVNLVYEPNICVYVVFVSVHSLHFKCSPIYINKFYGLCPKITKMRLSNPFIIKLTKPNGSVLIVMIELQIFRNHLIFG